MSRPPADRTSLKILLVDDDETVRYLVKLHALERGHDVVLTEGGPDMINALDGSFDVVVLDLLMPGMDGFECLRVLRRAQAQIPVIVLSSSERPDEVAESLQMGAAGFLSKPVEFNELFRTLEAAALRRVVNLHGDSLESGPPTDQNLVPIMGEGETARRIDGWIQRVASLDSPVLLLGDTGVGKSLIARNIHLSGRRAREPFVVVDCRRLRCEPRSEESCGSLPDPSSGRPGSLTGGMALADGGTLLLEEVWELPPSDQTRLLTSFEDEVSRPRNLEGAAPRKFRIIATSSVDLGEQVRKGSFRPELYHRLNVFPLKLPALRDRKEDIPSLLRFFSARFASGQGQSEKITFAEEVLDLMRSYPWPGNIRELENTVERIVALSEGGRIVPSSLPPEFLEQEPHAFRETFQFCLANIPLRELERIAVFQTLEANGGNRRNSAERLGVSEKTLYNIVKRHQG